MIISLPIKINVSMNAKMLEKGAWCVGVKCAWGEKNKAENNMA